MKKFLVFILVLLLPLLLHLQARGEKEGEGAEPEAGFAGSSSCKSCHKVQYETFVASPHGVSVDPRTPAGKQGCETCHGAGAKHVEKLGTKLYGVIRLGAKGDRDQNVSMCVQCHSQGKPALWAGSTHETRNLACTNCHQMHGGNPKFLAAKTQMDLCNSCHQQIKSQLQRMSHHPMREGRIQCSDCHNPHGAVGDKLVDAPNVNEKCYQCHTEKRGPFLWVHDPVVESCMNCHTPHGSTHTQLLQSKRPYLCQRCHSQARHPSTLYDLSQAQQGLDIYDALNSREFARSCNNCHAMVHGSNSPSGRFLNR